MCGKKVLVTGVYGLIGNLVYERLVERGYDVYGLARRQASSARVPEERLRRVPADHFYLGDLADHTPRPTAPAQPLCGEQGVGRGAGARLCPAAPHVLSLPAHRMGGGR